MTFAEELHTATAVVKPFTQKIGATVHGQGKLPADLLDEVALTFLFQRFELFSSIFFCQP